MKILYYVQKRPNCIWILTRSSAKRSILLFWPLRETTMNSRTDQDSVAGSIIQASGMVIFEAVLMTDAAAADTLLTCSIRTNPVVHLAAHVSSHLSQWGSPNLGKA